MPTAAPCGLTSAEATARLATDGANDLPRSQSLTWPRAMLRQLRETVIVVLLVAATLTAAVGDLPDMSIILAVVVINSVLGAAQEVRSGRALDELARLAAPHATVRRDGVRQQIPARDVVRGDLLLVCAGDIVAADGDVAEAHALQVDEAVLTGESVPADKSAGAQVHAGTVVTRGRGEVLVTAVGTRTAVGGIARALGNQRLVLTPLQRQLARLGRALAIGVAIAAVVVATVHLLLGHSVESSTVIGISLAVAAIPESLPAVVSLALALAARRMTSRGVLVRRLAAVETLGSVTVLACDKTGTLTEGRMRVSATWTPPDRPAAADREPGLMEAAVLCNDADGVTASDPLETALLLAARQTGVDVEATRQRWQRVSEEPFDAQTARMTTVHRDADGHLLRLRKGAPEKLLGECGGPTADLARVEADRMAAEGQRVIAVSLDRGTGWLLLGLVALADPPRGTARDVIAAFRAAGVRPVMITGDHAATAEAIANAVGIPVQEPGGTRTRRNVHARVKPDEKMAIVTELQALGEVVAMTGDGVNDAPALHAADIGVAMGHRGTEVAKQAADMILTRDDLAAMVPAIAEGRRAYDNLRRFLRYALSGGIAEVLVMLAGPIVGLATPLQAGQILWVNLLTHGLPGVAMGGEAAEPDVLHRPPRSPGEPLVDRRNLHAISALAAAIAGASLGVGMWAHAAGRPWQSMLFVTLTCAQLGVAIALRPRGAHWRANPGLIAAVAVNLVLTVLAVLWEPLQDLLRTGPLSLTEFAICGGAALVVVALAALCPPSGGRVNAVR